MPLLPLAPFFSFESSDFRVGGHPETVMATGAKWVHFGQQATAAAASLRAINDGGFIGSEGDKFRELINADFPEHLDITGQAHGSVGEAINQYGKALLECLTAMGALTIKARGDHAAVQAAVTNYNTAEALAAAAKTKAATMKVAAAAAVVTPAGPAVAGVAAKSEAESVAAEANKQAARAEYETVKAIWDADVHQAAVLKEQLGSEVTAASAIVDEQARKRFEENPSELSAAWQDIKSFVHEHADMLKMLADALQIVGSIMLLIPGLNVIGAVLVGVGVALKGLLALCGECSWGEFAFDLVTSLPGGAIFKAMKAGKLGVAGMKAAKGMSKVGKVSLSAVKTAAGKAALKTASGVKAVAGEKAAKAAYSKMTRGGRVCFDAEPVDMATGVLVDYQTDVAIDGILPLVVDRNSNSGHELGRALGPQWVCSLDCRIEVCAEEVLMLTPDGALVTFPPAPTDGSEVRADGRPWLLSFTDGAYRVRNSAAGIVYVFAIAVDKQDLIPEAPLTDPHVASESMGKHAKPDTQNEHDDSTDAKESSESQDASVDVPMGWGVPAGSVAHAVGMGIEYNLSTIVHRSGQWIECDYDGSTGWMTGMRRSDGTQLSFGWDRKVNRVASVWVSHTNQPEVEPLRLISYEYDMWGRLRYVINSNMGRLEYHYDQQGRINGWTDRNKVSYRYVFDDAGRVITQVGTGGMFANALMWLDDEAQDAPEGGSLCVLVETAGEFPGDPHEIGDGVIAERLAQLEALPLVTAVRTGGLQAAGLTGCGRDGARTTDGWSVPKEWLHDEVLGDVRPTVYRATAEGDVWRIINPLGECVDYAYNQYHDVTRMVAADGGVTEISYDEDGGVIATCYPDGSVDTIEPAAWGTPAKITGRDGLVTELEVDPAGNITAITSPAGSTVRLDYEWRPSGLVPAGSTDAAGVHTAVECDDAGRILAETDAAGRRWSVVRDAAGRVIESMNPIGETTRLRYTPEGWPCAVINPDGTTQTASYDGEGNLVETVNEIGAVTTTRYTVFDTPVETTDAVGGVTRLIYNTQMEPIAVINADGHRWSYTRNLAGQVAQEEDYNGIVTQFQHNAHQGWHAVVDAAGGVSTTWTDLMGRTTCHRASDGWETRWSYDHRGWIETVTTPTTRVSYAWDEYGRLDDEIVETTTTVGGELADGELTAVSALRDPVGRASGVMITLPTGQQVTQGWEYDPTTGEVISSQVGLSGREVAHVGLGSDTAGRRNRVDIGSIVRQYGFDPRGRITTDKVLSLDHTTGGATSMDSIMHAGGAGIRDVAGARVVAGRSWSWRDDSAITAVDDALAGVARFDVDALGRVTGVSRHTPHRTSTATTPGTATPGTSGGFATSESYGLSSAGVFEHIETREFTLDDAGAITWVASAQDRTRKQGVGATRVETRGTLVTKVGWTSYTYDKLGRVTEAVTRRLSRQPLVKKFAYAGSSGQVVGFVSSDAPQMRWEYTYDGLGRRVAKQCVDTSTNQVVSRIVFVYSGNRLVGEYTTVGAADGAQHKATTAHSGTGVAPSQGAPGQVGRVWIPDPVTGQIIGQLHLNSTGSTTAHHPSSRPVGPVAEWSQEQVDAQFYALVADLAGAPRELIDPDSGQVVGRCRQSVFGRRHWSGDVSSPLLFDGQYQDLESGWVSNRYRYYDPYTGVYGSQDPLGVGPNPGSAQGYVTNPLTWVDTFGLISHKVKSAQQELEQINKIQSQPPAEIPKGHKLDPHILDISRAEHPETAVTFDRAMSQGQPDLLQRAPQGLISHNRAEATRGWNREWGSPDEFPYASTVQGGTGSTVVGVSLDAQRKQGSMLSAFYRSNNVKVGDWFRVNFV